MKRNPMIGGSVYTGRDGDKQGSPESVYGRFEEQQILGMRCAIVCERIDDGDPRAVDMLGCAMRRGRVAIHISGKDPMGDRTGPGFIRELCMNSVDWLGREDRCSGLGCAEPEPAAIVTWDAANHRRPGEYMHHAFWGGTDGYVSFDGIYQWWTSAIRDADARLTHRAVCEELERRTGRPGWYCESQHTAAIGRLLNEMVGVSNYAAGAIAPNPEAPALTAVLRRHTHKGRRYYRFEMPDHG